MRNEAFTRLCLWDYVNIGYNSVVILTLVFFHNGLASWPRTALTNILVIVGIMALVKLHGTYSHALVRFFRFTYPFFLTAVYYDQAGGLVKIVTDQWFDPVIIAFENWLFGSELTLITEKFSDSWLTEVFLLGYFSYYPLMAFTPLYSYFKAGTVTYFRIIFAYVFSFAVSFPMYFWIPVEGPRWRQLPHYDGPLPSGFFVDTVYKLIDCCAAHGGAMPSTHTSASTVYIWALFSVNRTLGKIFFPFYVALVIGTVWGRFHYVTDVFIGLLIGVFSILISKKAAKWHFGN